MSSLQNVKTKFKAEISHGIKLIFSKSWELVIACNKTLKQVNHRYFNNVDNKKLIFKSTNLENNRHLKQSNTHTASVGY
jgi:hypothetical protein